ncbi:hypothetical protein QEZ40_000452 [Streptomyces katrae]|uniref:Chorismate mutase n=1 Tax=Streptomyces katrae TaxID=68223 RepID=A0ABT7GR93_9ACTN|nr:hypothetical protein [Streptomyces katrae]MDK9496112.1 hypothetical protein [Streptomyces katrae]
MDELDTQIISLVHQRTALHEKRRADRGGRVDLAHDNAVLRRFRAELGEAGTRMAMLLIKMTSPPDPGRGTTKDAHADTSD